MSRRRTFALIAAVTALPGAACSTGTTPDCADAQCTSYTVLPPLDGQVDAAEDDSGDAATPVDSSTAHDASVEDVTTADVSEDHVAASGGGDASDGRAPEPADAAHDAAPTDGPAGG